MRFFFEVSYKGTRYHGWQSQPNATGVQEVLEDALSTIIREKLQITGSGRTDTGVHCKQQFFHVDIDKKINPQLILHKLNSFLPDDISINNILSVQNEAHARFDAIKRSYSYHIARKKDPFKIETSFFYGKPLDVPTMNEAASLLTGKHDFQSFSKVKTEVNNFVCEVYGAHWEETEQELKFYISANRFLRGMVRAIVGTLLDVGKGKLSVEDFKLIIISRDRKKAGAAAPPNGLFLSEVKYPDDIFI